MSNLFGWIIWGGMLLAQSAAFTWVSRSRNSASVGEATVASIFSNGLFVFSMYFAVGKFGGEHGILACIFYTALTTIGASLAHRRLLARKVAG